MTDGGIGAFDLQGQTGFAGPALALDGAPWTSIWARATPINLSVGGVALRSGVPTSTMSSGQGVQPGLGHVQPGFGTAGPDRHVHVQPTAPTTESVTVGGKTYELVLGQLRHRRDRSP